MRKPELRNVLAIVSAVGVVATAVVAVLDGMKVKDVLDNAESGVITDDVKKEVAKKCTRTAFMAFVTLATGFASHRMSNAEIAVLTGSVGYLMKNRRHLEWELEQAVGKENLNKIKKKFVEEYHKEIEDSLPKKKKFPAEETGYGDLLCYEAHLGRWFRSDIEHVDEAIRTFKLTFEGDENTERNYVSYNDFYELLGIQTTHIGHALGWAPNEDFCEPVIKFNTTILDGWESIDERIYLIEIDPSTYPIEYWQEV